MRLIADKGIYIIENLDLERLAKARAYEFAVVIAPLKILGGTGRRCARSRWWRATTEAAMARPCAAHSKVVGSDPTARLSRATVAAQRTYPTSFLVIGLTAARASPILKSSNAESVVVAGYLREATTE